MFRTSALAAAILAGLLAVSAAAAETRAMIIIKDHKFEPAEIRVPKGERVELTIDNQDATPEEFESHDLRVEKVIPGGSRGVVRFGPLDPGTYPFIGEFNQATAQGKVIVE